MTRAPRTARTQRRPNGLSVTRKPCVCKFLQRTAAEPGEPIVFDQSVSEYHITRPRGGHWIIFHCPQCGGAAPQSTRRELFAWVTSAEVDRLEELTRDLKTVDEAIRALGKPAHDMPRGLQIRTKQTPKVPSRVTSYRVFTFTRLSTTADVELTDYGVDGIRFTFQGKYLGKPKRRPRKGPKHAGAGRPTTR